MEHYQLESLMKPRTPEELTEEHRVVGLESGNLRLVSGGLPSGAGSRVSAKLGGLTPMELGSGSL